MFSSKDLFLVFISVYSYPYLYTQPAVYEKIKTIMMFISICLVLPCLIDRLIDLVCFKDVFLYVCVYAQVCVCASCTCKYPRRPEEGAGSSRVRTARCGCWDLSLGQLREQLVLLVVEPAFQPFSNLLLRIVVSEFSP